MALTSNEVIRGRAPVQDLDGRLIVVGPDGVPIAGGGGGGSDPLSDGTPGGGLPTKTLWVAGADGAVLRGIVVDSSGRQRVVVEGTPAVSVSNFPATQTVADGGGSLTVDGTVTANAGTGPFPVSDNGGSLTVDGTVTANQGTPNSAANKWPVSVSDGTSTAQVLAAAPGSDTGQSALAVRVISQLGAGSGGGGGGTAQADKSAFTEGTTAFTPLGGVLNETISADPTEDQAAAARITPKRAVHTNLRNNSGTEIATSANPVRTDPTGTTTQPVSGTVTANAGTGPFPVSDNAGSLTVDAPVGTPVFVRLSDGTAAIATLTTDPSDRATREVGRTRIWDGTDEATVLPRGTVPTGSEKGVCVVPLNVSRPAYQVVSGQLTGPTAVAVTQVMSIWHPSSVAKDIFIIEIGVNYQSVTHATGRFDYQLTFTSADAATGGTTATPQPLDTSLPASGALVSFQRTTGATPSGQIFQRAAQPAITTSTPYITAYDGIVIYRAKDLDDYSDAIRLRNGIAEGLLVQSNIAVALAAAPIFNIYARWIERA